MKRTAPEQSAGGSAAKRKAKVKTVSRKKQPGFNEEIFSETSYFIRSGLRCVQPYYFTFTTHAKGRWVGSKAFDVFCREFQAESAEYYERAFRAGKVSVNGSVATLDTVVGHNALVCHRVHRHEPPVTAAPLRIIHQDEHVIVLNKPSSIPVHPCGRYRHNTVVFLLGKEHNLRNVHTVHRLDRLTSGLLIFAKSVGSARRFEKQIKARQVAKEYLCRVQGEFPKEPVKVDEPILVVSNKLGVCKVDPAGKPCSTSFTRLSFNGTSSVVKCCPRTGRMHQIRVHLQWLGYPVLNDPLYGHPAWHSKRGDIKEVISEIVKSNYNSEACVDGEGSGSNTAVDSISGPGSCANVESELEDAGTKQDNSALSEGEDKSLSSVTEVRSEVNDGSPTAARSEANIEGLATPVDGSDLATLAVDSSSLTQPVDESGLATPVDKSVIPVDGSGVVTLLDPDCTECKLTRRDPTPNEMIMYLHALSYKGPDWEYSTELPEWASPDWTPQPQKNTQLKTPQ